MGRRISLLGYFIADHPLLSALILAVILGSAYFGYRVLFAIGVVMEFWQ